jgi:uncharacterized protein YndB with AHSA1/START domain
VTHELRVERVIDAEPEAVFDAFTEPGGQVAFYQGPVPGWIVRSNCDLRVGGVWSVEFGPAADQLYRHRHVFEVIDRPRRIVLATTETRLDGSSFDTEIELVFERHGDKTLVRMLHRGFPTAGLRDEHRGGVPEALAAIERVIRQRGDRRT